MARRPTPEWTTLRLRVPRGYEEFWRLIRQRAAKDIAFTTTEIADETNVQRQSVEHYVARLRAGGFVELVPPVAGQRVNLYRLLKRPHTAPRLRDDGSEITGPSAQDRLWRAMRAIPNFTTRELAYTATVDKQKVPLKTAQRYINQLVGAGYLDARGVSRRPATYRLKPGMNTGPLPPSLLRVDAVWDRNLQRVMGERCIAVAEGQP